MDWLGIVCLLLCFVRLVAANLSFGFFLSFHKCMSMHFSFGFPLCPQCLDLSYFILIEAGLGGLIHPRR
jgi:hypothetical protein